MTYRRAGLMALATLNLLACSEPASQKAAAPAPAGPINLVSKAPDPPENLTAVEQTTVAGVEQPATLPEALVTPAAANLPAQGQAVNEAQFAAKPDPKAVKIGLASPQLIKVQVLLDRAHFSPGEIDGRDGTNQQVAIAAFETAHNLPVDGKLDDAVWAALTEADAAPVMQSYTITAEDVA
ncbi:MAG: peptidoglycan-binding domain-containing protein, partial [Caulobacteraceae bacterium]